jgi:hypothetical protein
MDDSKDFDRAQLLNLGKKAENRSVPFLSPENEIKTFQYLKKMSERVLEDNY